MRAFSARLREQNANPKNASPMADGEPVSEEVAWSSFRAIVGTVKALRHRETASFSEVALHYSKGLVVTSGSSVMRTDLMEVAVKTKKGAAMAFGDLCLREGDPSRLGAPATPDAEEVAWSELTPEGVTKRMAERLKGEQLGPMLTMVEHLQALLVEDPEDEQRAHNLLDSPLPTAAARDDIRELYASNPRIRLLMDSLMTLKASTHSGTRHWPTLISRQRSARGEPQMWTSRKWIRRFAGWSSSSIEWPESAAGYP